MEWLNDVFQRHISALEAELLERAQVTFGPPPNPPFFNSRALSSRLGAMADSRDSSRNSRTKLPGAAPMEADEATSSTPQGSIISSVVVAEKKKPERPAEASRSKYVEKVKELDLEDLECRLELAKSLGLEQVSHVYLGRLQCVDWLKAHETHFSRAKMTETADLTGIPTKSVMGPINYRPLKSFGSPGFVVEPPKHRTSIARIRVATPAQLRVVDKLMDPREMELPDAAYEGTKLANDPRYGKPCGNTQLAKILAVYDRADPAAARVVIVAGSDFEGTSSKLFWPETLIYSLPGAELKQMLTLVVAVKSEMPCEPELLLFAGMNDHLHATGFLEQLNGDEPTPKKIWEAIQTLFSAMKEVQENVASRFGSKTKVAFTTSPGYASMPPAMQFVYAILILIAEGNGWRILMAAPNRELEATNLRVRKSELAAAWEDVFSDAATLLTGEEKSPKTREEWRKVNGGMSLLTDLCLAMRSDPMGMIRGLGEVVTCIYGPAVTFAFPDPLVKAYRHSVTHVSLISVLDGTTLNWCQQEVLRAQMSNTVLFER